MSILHTARLAYEAGLCVLPTAADGSKRPDVSSWKRYQTTRPTAEEMRAFDLAHRSGMGIVAGAVSQYRECWDFDDLDTYHQFVEAATSCGLHAVVQRIIAGFENATPGGGRRWIVTYPPEVAARDVTLARRPGRNGEPLIKTLIELPTFAIVAPSDGPTHPSGKPYVQLSGSFADIASYDAAERDDLIALARSFDAMPRKAAPDRPAAKPIASAKGARTRPGDVYNRHMTWPQLLEPAGWAHVYDQGGTSYWRRPGKAAGISASTNHGSSDLFYPFTNSTEFAPETSYSKFAVYTTLEHHGDFATSTRALAKLGYEQRDDDPAPVIPPPDVTATATAPVGVPKPQTPQKRQQGRDVEFNEPEPWPEAVDGATLLDGLATIVSRYLALPQHADAALALWVLHAYTVGASFTSPILAITSPLKRCGKTLLLIVLGALVPRRLFASNVTPAVLFRTIEKYEPTLLIDEADSFIRDNEELRGVLNSGHTRTTAVVIRAVGDDHDPRAFSTWCPKVIALIGKLPDTLADRAIEVPMRRRTPDERVARLRQGHIERECLEGRQQAARWAADHLQALQDADPPVPASLHDRAADCWRPLLAIADQAGEEWPARARAAATALSGDTQDSDQSAAVLLLADVRTIFDAEGTQELSSADLAKALRALDSRPWATWGKDAKGLTTHALARLLKDFKVHPGKLRLGTETPNGYTRRSFEDAWTRYPPSELEHWNIANNDGPLTPTLELEHPPLVPVGELEQPDTGSSREPDQPDFCSSCGMAVSSHKDGRCSSVPVVPVHTGAGPTRETDDRAPRPTDDPEPTERPSDVRI